MSMSEKNQNELTEQARHDIETFKVAVRKEVLSEYQRQRRGQRIYLAIGLVIGVAASAALFQWWGTIAKWSYLIGGAWVVAVVAMAASVAAFIWFRDSIMGKFFKASVASYEVGIENATQKFVPLLTKLLPKLDIAEIQTAIDELKKSGLQIAAYFAYTRARRMVMGWLVALAAGLAAFLGTTLLVKQNELLKQQIHLTEAARRSSYVMLMDNILNQVNEELKGADTTPYHPSRRLSTVTIGRIAALSQSLRPIRYLVEGDTLSRYLSPERGQLLLALVYARLDTIHTYPEIYAKSDFSSADLGWANLDQSYLENADLGWANFHRASLSQANLKKTILYRANLNMADIKSGDLSMSNLRFANLVETDLKAANLTQASLSGADLTWADLRGANLTNADFSSGTFSSYDKTNRISFYDLFVRNLKSTVLVGAKLDSAILYKTELAGAILDSVSITPLSTIEDFKDWQIKYWDVIDEHYRVDSDEFGRHLILPKNK